MTGTETVCCPICQGTLKPYDRRIRKAIDRQAQIKHYSLRRLRCQNCRRLHLELPDSLVPYKRYEATVIVQIITGQDHYVPSEYRTTQKIKRWYRQIQSILIGVWQRIVKEGFASPKESPNLYRLVRVAVNSGFWPYHPYGH